MIKRPTYKSIQEAAEKSDRAALESSKQKYLYLIFISPKQLRRLSLRFIGATGCALCMRFRAKQMCPLLPYCNNWCIAEWQAMRLALNSYKMCASITAYYRFISYAAKIYLKLLEI